jgi:(4-O-methyl)-D-glucuronate---lignin esterase
MFIKIFWAVIFVLIAMLLCAARPADSREAVAKMLDIFVPGYDLPDPLTLNNGEKVTDAGTWTDKRRPEIMGLYRTHVYGRSPDRPQKLFYEVFDEDKNALGGTAIRKQVFISFGDDLDAPGMDMLMYLPKNVNGQAPVFICLNFDGNHTVNKDPNIKLGQVWSRVKGKNVQTQKADESDRGKNAGRFPLEDIISRGYGIATIYYGDLDPDFDDGFKNGVHGMMDDFTEGGRPDDAWGAIGAWSWGLSLGMDYFEVNNNIDEKRVAVLGHSRLGKAALWAGAQDERFAVVISNESGCGGAAIFRRKIGETTRSINYLFPHWFCENFKQYIGDEKGLPVDQHMLIALIAPRPVYIASAELDFWSDPKGEFLGGRHADPVYRLLGTDGMTAEKMPLVGKPVRSTIGYHVRPGNHDINAYDWRLHMGFTDKHLI